MTTKSRDKKGTQETMGLDSQVSEAVQTAKSSQLEHEGNFARSHVEYVAPNLVEIDLELRAIDLLLQRADDLLALIIKHECPRNRNPI